MMTITRQIAALLLLLLWGLSATARELKPADIITLNNGDIYHGTVTQEYFELDTGFGRLAIPYARMADLHNESGTTRIHTRNGELISGTLIQQQFTVMRLLDPSLPIHNQDIASIEFGPWPLPPGTRPGADLITFHNGDRLRLNITTHPVMIKTGDSLKLLSQDQIHTLDLNASDDPAHPSAVMVHFNGNPAPLIGQLMNSHIEAQAHKQTLTIPLALIEHIQLKKYHRQQATHEGLGPGYLRDRFRDGRLGPELVVLRGGQFQRGDLQGDGDGDEQPAISLTLPRPFAIATHELSFEDYDRYCEATRQPKPDDSGWGRGRRPVINVSWEEAVAYTRWLSEQTGQSYRLPSDAEWEYAARGGTSSRYWWGDQLDRIRANCTDCGSPWDGEKSAPVGRFSPNPFGLFDSLGNVWEWVGDCYHDHFTEAPADGSALQKSGCGKRVIRGGAWSFPAREMRAANRWRDFPSRRSDDTGFRVVRELHYE